MKCVDGVTGYEPVTLAGPTCDSADVIARDYPMPPLNVGDVVVSPMMGAYTSVTSSRFNGIRPPRSSKSDFASARALPATAARCAVVMAHHDD